MATSITIKIRGTVKEIKNCLNCPFFIWDEECDECGFSGYVSCGCPIKDDIKTFSVYGAQELFDTAERPSDCPIMEIKEEEEE